MVVKHLRGQVLLITVLVLSIAVTIALSLIGRSVSDVSMSRNLEESARAFSAAEAGIEEALRTNIVGVVMQPSYTEGAGYQSEVAVIGKSPDVYSLPTILEGQTETVWLIEQDESAHYEGEFLDICWSKTTPVPALEIIVYYRSGAVTYSISRTAYDPGSAKTPANNFTAVLGSDGCGGMANTYTQRITLPYNPGVIVPLFMRIRPYYGNATVSIARVGDGNQIPQQGLEVSSVGCTQITAEGCTEGGVTRKIVVRRQYPIPPPQFDYSIYSQGTLEQQ